MHRFDFLVIGSGPAGQRAAIQAAKLGKDVAIIEQRKVVGGVSVHTGTIPSKTLRETALYLTGWNQRGLYGKSYRLKDRITIDDLMNRLHITLQHEIEVIQHQLSRNKVNVIEGVASFIDANHVQVLEPEGDVSVYEAGAILISTGTRPIRPEGIPFDDDLILDSDGIVQLKKIPKSMAVIGAGVIGVEYASIFATLDIEVTLIDSRSSIMGFLDQEIIEELTHDLRDNGVLIRLNEKVAKVEKDGSGHVITHLESSKRIMTDVVLVAAGRMGSTYGLNLDNAGVNVDGKRRIIVNENYQTNIPNIYAAGDVIGFPSLASTSMEQGRRAACHAFDNCVSSAAKNFPYGIYSVPEISMVGMTEHELTEKKIPYETGIARFRETARGQIVGLDSGMLKMLISLEDRRILGVHILGEGATELIHIGQAAIVLGGKLDYFLENVFNYPTLAEAYKIAALDAWNRMASLSGIHGSV